MGNPPATKSVNSQCQVDLCKTSFVQAINFGWSEPQIFHYLLIYKCKLCNYFYSYNCNHK